MSKDHFLALELKSGVYFNRNHINWSAADILHFINICLKNLGCTTPENYAFFGHDTNLNTDFSIPKPAINDRLCYNKKIVPNPINFGYKNTEFDEYRKRLLFYKIRIPDID